MLLFVGVGTITGAVYGAPLFLAIDRAFGSTGLGYARALVGATSGLGVFFVLMSLWVRRRRT